MIRGIKRLKAELQLMAFVNPDISRQREIGLTRPGCEQRIAAHGARPPAQVRTSVIEGRYVPELLRGLSRWKWADARGVRLIAKCVQTGCVAELGHINGCPIG